MLRKFISSREPIIEGRRERALISAVVGFVAAVIVSGGMPDPEQAARGLTHTMARDAKDAAIWNAIGAEIGAFCAAGLLCFTVLSFGGTKRTGAPNDTQSP